MLRKAEEAGFDVLLTIDKNLTNQLNLSKRKIAIVALGRNRWSLIRPVLPAKFAECRNAPEVTFGLRYPLRNGLSPRSERGLPSDRVAPRVFCEKWGSSVLERVE